MAIGICIWPMAGDRPCPSQPCRNESHCRRRRRRVKGDTDEAAAPILCENRKP